MNSSIVLKPIYPMWGSSCVLLHNLSEPQSRISHPLRLRIDGTVFHLCRPATRKFVLQLWFRSFRTYKIHCPLACSVVMEKSVKGTGGAKTKKPSLRVGCPVHGSRCRCSKWCHTHKGPDRPGRENTDWVMLGPPRALRMLEYVI